MHRLWVGLAICAAPVAAQESSDWAQVGAILTESCVVCHSGEYVPFGTRLDTSASGIAGRSGHD